MHFEIPVERIARVELPPPHTQLILWSWHRLPAYFSVLSQWRSASTRPNSIHEREVNGASPHQLKAAFIHLSSLAAERARFLAAATENILREDAPRHGQGEG